MPDHIDADVCAADAAVEQSWIASALSEPVLAPRLRIWTYLRPAVVLGRSRRADEIVEEEAARAGLQLCIRPSGGGAVLAGPWLLGASVILPPQHALVTASIPRSFRWLGEAHAFWLRDIGVAARAVGTPSVSDDKALSWACFGSLSHWEVEAGGRKIVGLAQARRRHGVLLSAGVLLSPPPWEVLCEVLGQDAAQASALARRTISCSETLGQPRDAEALASSLLHALSAAVQRPRQSP